MSGTGVIFPSTDTQASVDLICGYEEMRMKINGANFHA
jgi:hypothetical protein